jgi:hypothetical protein
MATRGSNLPPLYARLAGRDAGPYAVRPTGIGERGSGIAARQSATRPERVEVVDAETGEVCTLNSVTAVEAAPAVGDSARAQAPNRSIVDALPAIAPMDQAARMAQLQMMRARQAGVLHTLADREATREAFRADLLSREPVAWRREELQRAFAAERVAAHEALNKLRLDQEMALSGMLRAMGMLR